MFRKQIKLPHPWMVMEVGQNLADGGWTGLAYNIDTRKYVAVPESEEQPSIEATFKLLNRKIKTCDYWATDKHCY